MIWNISEMSALHLICATVIFVVDCCQFCSNWVFGLEMELMACADLVGVTTDEDFFFLFLYDSINGMKHFWTVWITTQPCHSNFCCWLLPICLYLDVWAENGAYGLRWLVWRYNGAKLYFPWPNMILSMIWKSFEISVLHLSRATVIFVVDCCQFRPNWMFWLKMELMACANLVGGELFQIQMGF